jgi:hypothetical protein
MTEPDEALLWARKDYARQRLERGRSDSKYEAELIRDGAIDLWTSVSVRAQAYRAGQAASAERVKALEEAIRRLLAASEPVETYTHEVAVRLEGAVEHAEALLKEADQ